eukprot:99392_1
MHECRIDRNYTMENKQKFGPWLTIIFTLNYIIGAGFLSLGQAFYNSGLLLGVLILVLLAWLCSVSKDMVLVIMARAGNVKAKEIQSLVPASPSQLSTSEKTIEIEMETFQQEPSDQEPLSLLEVNADEEGQQNVFGDVECLECLCIGDEEIEISAICGMYGGPYAEGVTVATLSLSYYGVLWVFGTLFGHSLAEQASGKLNPNLAYLLWLGVFAATVIPLSCKSLEEQALFQVVLAGCRIFVMVVMIVVVIVGGTFEKDGLVQINDEEKPPLANWMGLGTVLSSGIYAFNFHFSIPVLCHPVENKRELTFIFNMAILICILAYVILGASMAYKFGDNIESSCNMNFSGWVPPEPIPHWLGNVVSTLILIFPAIDVLSAYPLQSITLGENLLSVFGKVFKLDRSNGGVVVIFRLLASTPPLIGAAIYRNFGTVVDIAGLAAYIMVFCIPAILLWKSSKLHPCHPTVYDTILTKTKGIDTVFGTLGNVIMLLAILDLVHESTKPITEQQTVPPPT